YAGSLSYSRRQSPSYISFGKRRSMVPQSSSARGVLDDGLSYPMVKVKTTASTLKIEHVRYRARQCGILSYSASKNCYGCQKRSSHVSPPSVRSITTWLLHLLRGCHWLRCHRRLAEPVASLRRGAKHCRPDP